MSDDLQHVNLANWEARVPIHATSETYDLAGYLDERTLGPTPARVSSPLP